MSLVLCLSALSAESVAGIYEVHGVSERLPARMLFLEPAAAAAFLAERSGHLVCSDMFRSPESSLAAVRSGRGAHPPGYSGHNFGLSIDLDLDKSMTRLKMREKGELDEYMESFGYFCHRRDHKVTSLKGESHHFNYLGVGTVVSPAFKSTSGYLEARIMGLYGDQFTMDATEAQVALRKMRLYSGEPDGKLGPLSQEALRVFRRGWGLGPGSRLDARTQRTLAYVTAERELV